MRLLSGNRINAVVVAIDDGGGYQLSGARRAGVSMRAEKANFKFIAQLLMERYFQYSKSRKPETGNFIINHFEMFYHNTNDHIIRAATQV